MEGFEKASDSIFGNIRDFLSRPDFSVMERQIIALIKVVIDGSDSRKKGLPRQRRCVTFR
jgi:hypothetical protein